jgi:tetratricopeptide (TPR) repeat protein
MKPASLRTLLVLSLFSLPAVSPARAAEPGQEDLDKATEAKLNATTPNDLGKVIDLLQSAIDKGLDEGNEKFAETLLTSTLLERAQVLSRLIFDQSPPDERWPQIRQVVMADVERALAIDENQPQGHFVRGRLLALPGGDRDGAIESFGKVIDAEEDAVEPKTRALALVYRGSLVSETEKQLADFNRAVELLPNDVDILRNRAVFHLRENRVDEAVADFQKVVELEPESPDARQQLGLALIAGQKLDEAMDQFKKAAELAPEEVSPLINQARVLGGQRDYDQALSMLEKALSIDPTSIPVLMFRVQVHLQKEDSENALADLEQVISLRPDAPEGLNAMRIKAEILARTERIGEAIKTLGQVIDRAPENVELLTQMAVLHLMDDNYTGAIDSFSKVLELEDEDVATIVAATKGRSDAYLSIGEHAKAIEDYERAIKLAPEDDTILNNFSWVLSTSPHDELRNGTRALELAEKACEVTDYEQPHILSTLAAAHAELGDFEKAREWSAKAIELGEKVAEAEEEPGPAAEQLVQLKAELESYKQEKPWRELQEKQKDPSARTTDAAPAEIKPAPAATSEF